MRKHPISISKWDNAWNKLACELAKSHLNPSHKPDVDKISRLRMELRALQNSPSRWDPA